MAVAKLFLIVFLGIYFVPYLLLSQNLIPNSGFEYYSGCPQSPSKENQIHKAYGWNTVNRATPDFFHTCANNVPQNYMGHQTPFDGNGYAGILVDGSWQEYLMVMLGEPLIKGVEYKVSMYVALSQKTEYAISEIGFCFTKEYKYYENTKTITDLVPQVVSDCDNFLSPTTWTLVEGKYKASGGERFIVIGNFHRPTNTKKMAVKLKVNTSIPYYYIDNVSTEPILIKPKPENIVKLYNIYFANDKAELVDSSFSELDKLVSKLKTKHEFNIEIMGHTDNVGREGYNINLSEKRAKAVADYIVNAGISNSRVSYKGYGNTKPISKNNSVEHRHLNRRVEVKIVKGNINSIGCSPGNSVHNR